MGKFVGYKNIPGILFVCFARSLFGVGRFLIALCRVLTKNYFVVGFLVFFIGSFLASTIFEDAIKRVYPEFSGEVMLSSAVFFYGIAYAIIERSILICIMAVIAASIVPMFHNYFTLFWPLISKAIVGG